MSLKSFAVTEITVRICLTKVISLVLPTTNKEDYNPLDSSRIEKFLFLQRERPSPSSKTMGRHNAKTEKKVSGMLQIGQLTKNI